MDVGNYQEGLADLWVGQDGERYGLPKDFDTVAIFYNKALIADAGVDEAELAALEWNPEDGGTYEEMIAHLTIDNNGRDTSPAVTAIRMSIIRFSTALSGLRKFCCASIPNIPSKS